MTTSTDTLALSGRTAVVLGASRGIGRATAQLFARRGATVYAMARSLEPLEALAQELSAEGCRLHARTIDLDDLDGLRPTLAQVLGETPVQIVVHNTGGPKGGPLVEAELDQMQAALHRHLFSAHTILQAVLPGMREAGYGRWINVLSTSVREPIPNLGVSNLTRAAMASWAKTLSRELPPGITINNVLPGFTDTDRLTELGQARAQAAGISLEQVREQWIASVPEGRLAQPEETAEAIAFLASPAGAFIRGHSLPVDGGRMASIA